MKKKVFSLQKIVLSFVIIVSFFCSKNQQKEEAAISKIGQIKEFANAEVMIERLRKQQNPVWEKISDQFNRTVPIVKEIDSIHNLNYYEKINNAISDCNAGKKVKVNQQILAKGLQHIAVLSIFDEMSRLVNSGTKEKKVYADRIKAFFEGIRPTFIRRDKDFFNSVKTLEKDADNALQHLTDLDYDVIMALRELRNIIFRAYALCVIYEIIGVEKYRDQDLDICAVKQKEAEIFYRIIRPEIKKHSEKADEIILNMLSGNYENMDSKIIEENIQLGLKVKIRE